MSMVHPNNNSEWLAIAEALEAFPQAQESVLHVLRTLAPQGPPLKLWHDTSQQLKSDVRRQVTFLNALGFYYLPPLDGQEAPQIHPELAPLLDENLRLRREAPVDPLRLIPGLINRAALHALHGEDAQARALLEEALEMSAKANGAYRVRVQRNLGSVLTDLEEHSRSQAVLQEALHTLEANSAERSEDAAWIRHNLAFNFVQLGNPKAAEKRYRRNVQLHREPSANLAELVAASAANLARLTTSAGETLQFAAALIEGSDAANDNADAVETSEEPTVADKKVRVTQ